MAALTTIEIIRMIGSEFVDTTDEELEADGEPEAIRQTLSAGDCLPRLSQNEAVRIRHKPSRRDWKDWRWILRWQRLRGKHQRQLWRNTKLQPCH